MKKLTILLFSILISFSSYGEWTEVVESSSGTKFYIDKGTIIENSGYVYYWKLGSSPKPIGGGSMSAKFYNEADCGIKRERTLSYTFYKKPMGKDKMEELSEDNPKWDYPHPKTVRKTTLDYVCSYVK